MTTETAAATKAAKKGAKGEDLYGRDATWPVQIPLRGWGQIFHRVWYESSRDNISVVSAGCAFYALFAIFPALAALIALYGLMISPDTIEEHFKFLNTLLPDAAYAIVQQQIERLAGASGQSLGWGLGLSLGLAFWSTNNAALAMFAALNIAYEEPERRSVLQFYFAATVFSLVGILGGLLMLLAIVYVPNIFAFFGFSDFFDYIVRLARWPFLALVAFVLLTALYRYGPCRKPARWRWASVGSVIATVLWLAASAGFSLYVADFAQYGRIYGSLGAVIILLFWFYLSFFIVILGAEINAELELQTAKDTTSGTPKPMGERGAFVADHVAGGPTGAMRPYNPEAGEWREDGRGVTPG
ncbi:YihY/virulence factor BrkB family protein [Methyloligella sp. 2.7D]|uniref:YihY/virulence factor BrkB family protein n=1 Tax=unclassified Methyloligella TaxID=2625955 RepID=UPI00157BE88D|nr:YihY/virulence factor BrkB family protein [Methyloligella sp. GL2]QKP77630.1 YihY/virulence factor BrkB family protein [Methyloligella sp. GL2]